MEHEVCTISPKLTDPCAVDENVADAVPKPEGFPAKSSGYHHVYVRSTFSAEMMLRRAAVRSSWSPIVKRGK